MLSGSGIMDEASHALIPLQGSHALIGLQSQLHQQGLHNPLCTAAATTQGWFAPRLKLVRFQATGTTYNNCPEAVLVSDWYRGSICCAGADGVGLLLVQLSRKAKVMHSSLPPQQGYKD